MRRSGAHTKIITVTPDAPGERKHRTRTARDGRSSTPSTRAAPSTARRAETKQASRHDDGPHEAPRRRARARRRDFDRGAARDGRGCVESSRQRVTLSRELLRVLREPPPPSRHHRVDGVECLRFEISHRSWRCTRRSGAKARPTARRVPCAGIGRASSPRWTRTARAARLRRVPQGGRGVGCRGRRLGFRRFVGLRRGRRSGEATIRSSRTPPTC